jgi:Fur family peroxide stress response transcriptional regulator
MVSMDNITKTFKEKKLKLTPQRMAVYQYLLSTKKHPSAETIYNSLQPLYPTMSLATVYKTLKTLVSVNLIQEFNVGEGNFRYDANTSCHAHIQCLSCNCVDDIEDFSFDKINLDAKQFTNYEIVCSKVFFYGICPNCKDNQS